VSSRHELGHGIGNEGNASLAWNGFAQDADSHDSSFRSSVV